MEVAEAVAVLVRVQSVSASVLTQGLQRASLALTYWPSMHAVPGATGMTGKTWPLEGQKW